MSRRIIIRHPGYPVPNKLFTLPASDGPNRDCAHYATIRAIGSIFTDNEASIWLSRSQSGEPRVEPDAGGLMPGGDYFLHVPRHDPSETEAYAIVPNFRTWRFPHEALPPLWQQAGESDGNARSQFNFSSELLTTESCRISQKRLACESSHIIPASEKPWFASNEMDEYGKLSGRTGEAVVDSLWNQLRLKRDAHWLWDNLRFSIVPREDSLGAGEVIWFTQMMVEDEELYSDWHRIRLQPLMGRAPEFLYARFAWDIFPKLHAFLQAGHGRRLIVRRLDGETDIRMYNATECREFTLGQGRGRSASPTKRLRSEISGLTDAIHLDDEDWEEHDECAVGPCSSCERWTSDSVDSARV